VRCVQQGYYIIDDPVEYGYSEGSPEHLVVLEDAKREATTLLLIRHPNVVLLLGLHLDAATGTLKHLIMERATCTLKRHLDSACSITPAFLTLFSQDILQGLAYIHTLLPRPLIHRDVKADNVLLFIVVSTITAKLSDVDLAAFADSKGSLSPECCGALLYAAPELLKAGKHDAKIDVFSFGMMLAEAVFLYLPSKDAKDGRVSRGLKRPRLEDRWAMVAEALEKTKHLPCIHDLVRRCTVEDPSKRPTSWQALAVFPLFVGDCLPVRTLDGRVLRRLQRSIRDWLPGRRLELLYCGSRDGMTSRAFHAFCDEQGPTLTLIRSDNDCMFGGYASGAWSSRDDFLDAPDSFLFTVVNPYGDRIVRMPVNDRSPYAGQAMWCHHRYGPSFPFGVYITTSPDGSFDANCVCTLASDGCFGDVLGRGSKAFTGCDSFAVSDIEVYKVV
jgi:serine/threonine protein kinase